jgi:NADH dehydrogenase [ubiquinone] 1 alpha subcomplex assembly factor 6
VVGASETEIESARKYCLDLLRKYDRPSYTLSTFIPRQTQTFYLALRALNVSLSMIPDTTSSYTIGLVRLQFWRDAFTRTLSGAPPKEPIALLLGAAVSDLNSRTKGRVQLTRGWFMRLINAREQSLANTPYTNLVALESYAENTYSTLLYLTLSALPMTSLTADHLASHVGKAAGIAAILRGLPLVAFPPPQSQYLSQPGTVSGSMKQGVITLPLDVMAQTGVKEEDVFRLGAEAVGLRDAVFAVATRASDHLITARQMLKNLRSGQGVDHDFEHEGEEGHVYPGQTASKNQGPESQWKEVELSFGVLMPAISTQLWLDKLQKVNFDIFKPELLGSDWRLPWKAYVSFRRRIL